MATPSYPQQHHASPALAASSASSTPAALAASSSTGPVIPEQTNTATPLPSPKPAPGAAAPAAGAGAGGTPARKAPIRKVGKYQLGKTLGQGTFGKVKFATDTESGRHVAIKMMDKAKIRANNMGEQIKKEISIMKLIKHPSVIQLIEVLASATTIYIVLELVTGGELFDKIISQGCFSEPEAREYFHQLIGGIAQCHAHGVCHRDLKPENLLLDSEGCLKISDFGLSALSGDMQGGDLLHTTCLALGTEVALADELSSDAIPAAPPRCMRVEDLKVGMRLVGADEPVTVTAISPPQHAECMFQILHDDGSSYTVTPDHLVTLRWSEGPQVQMRERDGQRFITVRWWTWRDGKLNQCSLPEKRCQLSAEAVLSTDDIFMRDTEDELRADVWAEFESAAASNSSCDAAHALFAGDLIEVEAAALSSPSLWRAMVAEPGRPRATARRVSRRTHDLSSHHAEAVQAAFVSLPLPPVPAHTVDDVDTCCAVSPASSASTRLAFVLHDSALSSDAAVNDIRDTAAASRANLQRVWSDAQLPQSEFTLAADALTSDPASLASLLSSVRTSTFISCGRFSASCWREISEVAGVSAVVHGIEHDGGAAYTTFDYTELAVVAPVLTSSPRRITVWHTQHPCHSSSLQEISRTLMRALSLPVSLSPCPPEPHLCTIKELTHPGQQYVRFSVDGDNRFALRDGTINHNCGTPNYVAPEVLMDKGYDGKAADVWSSGVILYVLLAGFLPFDETSMVELFRKIVKADFLYPAALSPEAIDLLTIILNPDPEKRATIIQIRNHPWYRGKTFEEADKEEQESRSSSSSSSSEMIQASAQIQAFPDGTSIVSSSSSSTSSTTTTTTGPGGAAHNSLSPPTSLSIPLHRRAPSDQTASVVVGTPQDTNSAITWLTNMDRKGTASGVTPNLGPSDESPAGASGGMKPLTLEVTRVQSGNDHISAPATPSASAGPLLVPSGSFSPDTSPQPHLSQGGSGGGGSSNSAHSSPTSTSLQARRTLRMPSDASSSASSTTSESSDPLSLDEDEAEIRGPIPLNAFDLINMVGGAAMGRMFQPRPGADEKKVRTFTQFTSTMPVEEIFAKLQAVLDSMPETEYKLYTKPCVVKVSRTTPRGKILGSCQLYTMTPRLFMLEWRKLKGDVFLFHDFFREVKRKFTGAKGADDAGYGSEEEDLSRGGRHRHASLHARGSIDQRASMQAARR